MCTLLKFVEHLERVLEKASWISGCFLAVFSVSSSKVEKMTNARAISRGKA